MLRFGLIGGLCLLAALPLAAQFDPGGGTVDLTINGLSPASADPVAHDVEVGSAPWSLAIGGGGLNTPIIFLSGAGIAGSTLATPWGGSIDLAGAFVVLNGLFPASPWDAFAVTSFTITLPPLAGACGQGFGPPMQAIWSDGANPPFFLHNTQAGRPVTVGKTTTYDAIGDDAFVTHSLTCPVVYGGVTYTQFFIGSNGMVTFAAGSTDFTPTNGEFANGFRSTATTGANPGVAMMWGDYARATVTTDSISVVETFGIGTVAVNFLNQQHWNSQTSAGNFSVTFGTLGPDSLTFNLAAYGAPAATDTVHIIGVTDGTNAAGGTDTVGDLTALVTAGGGFYTSPASPESIMENFAAGVAPDFLVLNFIHMGGFNWTIY